MAMGRMEKVGKSLAAAAVWSKKLESRAVFVVKVPSLEVSSEAFEVTTLGAESERALWHAVCRGYRVHGSRTRSGSRTSTAPANLGRHFMSEVGVFLSRTPAQKEAFANLGDAPRRPHPRCLRCRGPS